jgi:Ankyrin repeats (3 copies)
MSIRDPIFIDAIAAIDAGDTARLDQLITQHPRLVQDRVPNGETGYFADPFLLWFVPGNPIRAERLAPSIVDITLLIIDHARRLAVPSLQQQLDYAVQLTATGLAPRGSGVQIALIDALVAAGAKPAGLNAALAHGEVAATQRLLELGAPMSLSAAACLGRWDEARRIAVSASPADFADALVTAAYLGNGNAVAFLLANGADPNLRSTTVHRHSSALHQAALAGAMDAVRSLVDAGASLTDRDTVHDGTPAGWAEHGGHKDIARFLRDAH